MFILKKFLTALLMPLPAALLTLWLGWWMLRRERWAKCGQRLILVAVVGLTVVSNKGVGLLLLRRLESKYPPQPAWTETSRPSAELAACRIVLVLGGGHADTAALSANNRLSPSALSRVVEGVRIARALPNAELWVSGPAIGPGKDTHASVLKSAAVSLGVDERRIKMIDDGFDTEGEALAAKNAGNDASIALVTSAWHLPRAVALFQQIGVKVVPCPADYGARINDDFRLVDYVGWDLSGLERSTKAIYEYLGFTWAKLRGRV